MAVQERAMMMPGAPMQTAYGERASEARDTVFKALRDLIVRATAEAEEIGLTLTNLADRALGPEPQGGAENQARPIPQGAVHETSAQIESLLAAIAYVRAQANRLNKLA